jgi:hypothetical protein
MPAFFASRIPGDFNPDFRIPDQDLTMHEKIC